MRPIALRINEIVLGFLLASVFWTGVFLAVTEFKGGEAEKWTASATIFQVAVTVMAVIIAVIQIAASKSDSRTGRTLEAASCYDLDPTLFEIRKRIRIAENTRTPVQNSDLENVFNYFESLAIGAQRGFYDDDLLKAHFIDIISSYIDEYSEGGKNQPLAPTFNLNGYDDGPAMLRRWLLQPPRAR